MPRGRRLVSQVLQPETAVLLSTAPSAAAKRSSGPVWETTESAGIGSSYGPKRHHRQGGYWDPELLLPSQRGTSSGEPNLGYPGIRQSYRSNRRPDVLARIRVVEIS